MPEELVRDHLPIPDRPYAGPVYEDAVRVEFVYDGGGLGKGGAVTLFVDGQAVGEGRVEATVPMLFSADETTDVGSDMISPEARQQIAMARQ